MHKEVNNIHNRCDSYSLYLSNNCIQKIKRSRELPLACRSDFTYLIFCTSAGRPGAAKSDGSLRSKTNTIVQNSSSSLFVALLQKICNSNWLLTCARALWAPLPASSSPVASADSAVPRSLRRSICWALPGVWWVERQTIGWKKAMVACVWWQQVKGSDEQSRRQMASGKRRIDGAGCSE